MTLENRSPKVNISEAEFGFEFAGTEEEVPVEGGPSQDMKSHRLNRAYEFEKG
jgi:hypothetical protein